MLETILPIANLMKLILRVHMVFQREPSSFSSNSMRDNTASVRRLFAMPMSTDHDKMLSEKQELSLYFSIRYRIIRFLRFMVMVHRPETLSMSLMSSRQTCMHSRKISWASIMWAPVSRLRSISSGRYSQALQILQSSLNIHHHSERYSGAL